MKKILLIGICSIFLVACSNNNEIVENSNDDQKENIQIVSDMTEITGEIVEIENGRFLVESTTKNLPDGKPYTIWFSTNDIEHLQVGQLVSVWTKAIDESLPAQGSAVKIEIKE